MNRLTLPHYGGKGHYMKCSESLACNGNCGDCDSLDEIVEKLAEYEDKEEQKPQTNAERMVALIQNGKVRDLLDWWEEIFEDGVPGDDYFEWWLRLPVKDGDNDGE